MKTPIIIMLAMNGFIVANFAGTRVGGLKNYIRYPFKSFYPNNFKKYLNRIQKQNRMSSEPQRRTNPIQTDQGGIVEYNCDKFKRAYDNPDFWKQAESASITLENYDDVCYSTVSKNIPVAACKFTSTSNDINIWYEVKTVTLRPSATKGCQIYDVMMKLKVNPPDVQGDCYLAIVNKLITLSCPPDELALEYRVLSLFSSDVDFVICAESGLDHCKAGPALALRKKEIDPDEEDGEYFCVDSVVPVESVYPLHDDPCRIFDCPE